MIDAQTVCQYMFYATCRCCRRCKWAVFYKMSWPAFPPGSAHVLFPYKMCVVFIYAVFPVPLGEIHFGDVSEANGRETIILTLGLPYVTPNALAARNNEA